ncbi:hypothetical protein SAY86_000081 [Trapa natans]|uniref:peptidylprolyl isomerase n=1 Tax=Trapa natans TaxID=22666 RepID=A0AAN7N0Q6_TRANT|nr:hypothetical protein SAY86_000081 [Trapa natans]
MGFWGIEVKPGKKENPYDDVNALGKLRITQATLGLGSSNEKSILQCFGEQKSPIFLCTLLPDKIESCSLDLEFDEDDSVIFSVVGKRSIHISGYFLEDDYEEDAYGFDHHGEDISDRELEESSDYDSEEAFEDVGSDDDIFSGDDHFDIYPKCRVVIEEIIDGDKADTGNSQLIQKNKNILRNSAENPKAGQIVIEEIIDDDKADTGNSLLIQKKKNELSNSADNPKAGQIVLWNSVSSSSLESEDEDGFPISKPGTQKKHEDVPEQANNETTEKAENKNKRSVKTTEQDDQPDRQKKRKKQKKSDKEGKTDNEAGENGTGAVMEDQKRLKEVVNGDADQLLSLDPPKAKNENQPEKKKKKNNKKFLETGYQSITTKVEKNASILSEQNPSQVRTFPNGLVVEELEMGKPDGKKAAPGKQVSVHYIGKLQKSGKIFDSNVGRAPFKFRLGIGQVIKGWDVAVNGMRVGDKRRLTIPPSMGYGAQGAGGKIPPNSWLVFDVELVDVR